MLDDQRPPRPAYGRSGFSNRHHNDRAGVARAREAAEALFRPKPTATETPIPDTSQQNGSARRPRMLAAAPPPSPPASGSATAPAAIQPETAHEIPVSEFARIRAWVAYGTTLREVAEMYGVPIEDIRRILRKA